MGEEKERDMKTDKTKRKRGKLRRVHIMYTVVYAIHSPKRVLRAIHDVYLQLSCIYLRAHIYLHCIYIYDDAFLHIYTLQ